MRLTDDISAEPAPLVPPTELSPRILVIGGGVTGLTTAWLLLDQGYHVTVISREWASHGDGPRLTSQAAGAVWELPPAGCGPQVLMDKLPMVQKWALESLEVYQAIARYPELADAYGVKMKMLTSFHMNRINEDDVKSKKVDYEQIHLEMPSRGTHLCDKYGVNAASHGGLLDANEHLGPIIDTDVAMMFLMRLIKSKGAQLETDTIIDDIVSQEEHLLGVYRANAIVNATGVWARDAALDSTVYPLRGATLRLINDGSDFPKVTNSMVVLSATDQDGSYLDMAVLIPRNDNILLLGSIFEDSMHLDLTPTSPQIQAMRRNCEDFLPALKQARLDLHYPLAQGRRPMRRGTVRVEREEKIARNGRQSRTVHSYGHGGAGWTLVFGSAREVVRLVKEVVEKSELTDSYAVRGSLRSRWRNWRLMQRAQTWQSQRGKKPVWLII
ncbi:hypothetical protein V492_06523 [Pseudogymnoascus sp. VKM F-4246]|nr:hypothetical protein V492_06523 [Pseudogymnoascus sp. VKM F-4246]